jgi:hypothetical protein
MPASVVPRRSRVRDAVGVFLLCLTVYLLNGRAHAEVDCVAAPYVAWSLVRHGSLDLSSYPDLVPYYDTELHATSDGRWVSYRPLGSALAAVPFVAPFAALSKNPPRGNTMLQFGKLTAAVWVAASVVLFFCLCRRLVPQSARLATILYAFGTCLWSVASQALWMHGPATFWLCAALLLLLPSEEKPIGFRRAALAGLCLGLAVLTRPSSAFFPLATGILWLLQKRWRLVLGLTLGGIGPLALHVGLNLSLHGNAILGGYHAEEWETQPPLWLSLGGLLIAPSRGLLVYSPALLLAPLGLVALRRDSKRQGLVIAWAGAAGLTCLFYARWYEWRGGWCFGPRFLCEALPILCLLFALGYETLASAWGRRIAEVLVVLSVAVHLVGVFGHRSFFDWQQRHELADGGRSLFALRDTQIEAHARSVLDQASEIVHRASHGLAGGGT